MSSKKNDPVVEEEDEDPEDPEDPEDEEDEEDDEEPGDGPTLKGKCNNLNEKFVI
jgi:hypothetical protein